jgi:hypothetical protein
MNGEYLRVSVDELARAVDDPEWALKFADEMVRQGPSEASASRQPSAGLSGAGLPSAGQSNSNQSSAGLSGAGQSSAGQSNPGQSSAGLSSAGLSSAGQPSTRQLSTRWTWHALEFLLRRAGFPVDVVYGEEAFAQGTDWGYGRARYLTVERVRIASGVFDGTGFDELVAGVEPADLARAEVHPVDVWGDRDSFQGVRQAYESLVPFFAAAVREGQAMIVWID